VSCGSVGHCSAGGYYTESIGGGFGRQQAFVVDQS
jgi:outer membrane lipoprotein SlyB